MSSWQVNGREAGRRDLAEALKLARQHRAKGARADREARDRDASARRVAAALRCGATLVIEVRPSPVRGERRSGTRLRHFEARLGLVLPLKASKLRPDGLSSFHFKLTPRGLGNRRRAKDRPYKRGEAVVAVRYILRDDAREIPGGGIVSNISNDPNEVAALFSVLEELEVIGGRSNAAVYGHLITSLPHELTSRERHDVIREICRPLAEAGLPHVGVLHKPDPEGDQRNWHAHVLVGWRPSEHLADRFALSADSQGALNTPKWVYGLRCHAAAAMNAAMVMAGHGRRFTAEKWEKKTAAREGSEKLGSGRKHRERRSRAIEIAEAEKAWREERASALGGVARSAEAWLIRSPADRAAVLELAERTEQGLLAAHAAEHSAPSQTLSRAVVVPEASVDSTTQSQVSREKPELTAEALSALFPASVTQRAPIAPPAFAPVPEQRAAPETRAVTTKDQAATPPPSPMTGVRPPDHTSTFADASRSYTPDERGTADVRDQRSRSVALAAARRAVAARQPDVEPLGSLAATGPLSGVRGLSSIGLVRDVVGASVLLLGVPQDQLAEGRRAGDGLRRSGDGDRRLPGRTPAGVSDASNDARAESTEPVVPLAAEATSPAAPALQSLAPPEGKKTGPTTARLREQLRAGNRDRSAVQVAVAPRTSEQEMRAVLKELSSVTYLPIRPINTDVAGRGRARFSLVVDKSAAEDADLIARVARVQEDEQAQKLLAAAWQAFLSRLRADLTTGRSDRPSTERIEWLDKGDPRLRAAFSAASDTREVASTLADARAYWDRRDQQAVPVAAPSSSAVPEPFELRNRGSDEEEDYQRLLAMGRFGAKTKGRD